MRILRGLVFLLLLTTAGSATLSFKEIGSISNDSGTFSIWLVRGGTPDPAAALKFRNTGKEGESNIIVLGSHIAQLKELCQKSLAYSERLTKGQIVLIGSIPSGDNKLDVAIINVEGATIRLLVAHDGKHEHNFVLNKNNSTALYRLFDKAIQKLESVK